MEKISRRILMIMLLFAMHRVVLGAWGKHMNTYYLASKEAKSVDFGDLKKIINTESSKEKKGDIMVLGVPSYVLNDYYSVSEDIPRLPLISVEEFEVHPRIKRANVDIKLITSIKKSFFEFWDARLAKECLFMRKIFCRKEYTQYNVLNSYYLPPIYCSKNHVDPVYIVVPSQYMLLEVIIKSDIDEKQYPEVWRKELDKSLYIFRQYVKQIYDLVEIKGIVVNYSCENFSQRDAFGDELLKLHMLDVLIREFGKFIYKENSNGKFEVYPQFFWINWYRKSEMLGNDQSLSIKKIFFNKVFSTWFDFSKEQSEQIRDRKLQKIISFRHTSLLYPFLNAHNRNGVKLDTVNCNEVVLQDDELKQMMVIDIDSCMKRLKINRNDVIQKWFSKVLKGTTVAHQMFRFELGVRFYYTWLYQKAISYKLSCK